MTKYGQKLIDRFNKCFPVGSKCWMRTYAAPEVDFEERIVTHEAYDLYGNAVAFFEGKSGCCSIDKQFVDYSRAS